MSERSDVAMARLILQREDGEPLDHDLYGYLKSDAIHYTMSAMDVAKSRGFSLGDAYVEKLRLVAAVRMEDLPPHEPAKKKPSSSSIGSRAIHDAGVRQGGDPLGGGYGTEGLTQNQIRYVESHVRQSQEQLDNYRRAIREALALGNGEDVHRLAQTINQYERSADEYIRRYIGGARRDNDLEDRITRGAWGGRRLGLLADETAQLESELGDL